MRDAIRDYSLRIDRLSEAERLRMLEAFDTLVAKIPRRRAADVDRELRQIAQESLFPNASALPFGPEESALAARLFAQVKRARGREIDLAIAAQAFVAGASLWTLDRGDFDDVPRLLLW